MEFGNSNNLISCGTTILAMEFDGGVLLAADSRTSCANFVTNRVTDKLTRLTDKIYCCRSGAAAHTQALADETIVSLNTLELQSGEEPLVRDAAVQMKNIIYKRRGKMVAGIIVAGWDQRYGGQVYNIPVSGFVLHDPCSMSGSGSIYINGFITAHYRPGLKEIEAVELVKNAILMSIHSDCASGGVVRIGIINKNGMRSRICHRDEPEMLRFTSDLLWHTEFGFS